MGLAIARAHPRSRALTAIGPGAFRRARRGRPACL